MLLDKYSTAWDILDMDGYLDCIDEDCEITFYATGRVMSLKEFSSQIRSLMVSAQFENRRLTYENEDILVTHSMITIGDDSREAVLQSKLKKDGLLWRAETGATPLPPKD